MLAATRVNAAESELACRERPESERAACFEQRERTIRAWVARGAAASADAAPPAPPPGPPPPPKPPSHSRPHQDTKPEVKNPEVGKSAVKPPGPKKPVQPAASKPVADEPPVVLLATLRDWASDALAERDAQKMRNAAALPTLAAEARAFRLVGMVLTIAGNCDPGKSSGRCEQERKTAADLAWRLLGGADSLATYRKVEADVRAAGLPEWEAGAIFALALRAQQDLKGLDRRLADIVNDSGVSERLKTTVQQHVLPAATQGPIPLAEAIARLPDAERIEVALLALRAALPAAQKRPQAHVALVETAAPARGTSGDDEARSFRRAIEQILIATTGHGVCPPPSANAGTTGPCQHPDATLQLGYAVDARARVLKITGSFTFADAKPAPAGVHAVDLALGARGRDCDERGVPTNAITAAWALMKQLEWSYGMLADVPHLKLSPTDLTQTRHEGARVLSFPGDVDGFAYDGPVAVTGQCGPAGFRDALVARLVLDGTRLGPNTAGTGVDLTLSEDRAALRGLQASKPDAGKAIESVLGTLVDGQWCMLRMSSGARELYTGVALAQKPEVWPDAGDEAATHAAAVLRKARVSPKPPPESPRHALAQAVLAPGLPLLTDRDAANDWKGYTWIAADTTALAATIVFAFLAIDQRNAAAGSASHDLAEANVYLAISSGSLIAWATSRVVSALTFGR
jgi:hypothetical protein